MTEQGIRHETFNQDLAVLDRAVSPPVNSNAVRRSQTGVCPAAQKSHDGRCGLAAHFKGGDNPFLRKFAGYLRQGDTKHMKGVILAGGTGSRLNPLTRVTNKHLLPVYNKPMVWYPVQALVNAGIQEILLVTGGKNAGDFLRLLGNGRDFGLKHLNYTYQEREGGIADALGLAEYFASGESICVILGDNIIEYDIYNIVLRYKKQNGGARILLKEVPNAQRFGVAEIKSDQVVGIEEKPDFPKSNYAVVGIYFYDTTVFQKIRRLKPSGRGELEITDVNNFYIEEGQMSFEILEGWWTDAGTFESLLLANNLVARTGANKLTTRKQEAEVIVQQRRG